jgi:hypothetical protein
MQNSQASDKISEKEIKGNLKYGEQQEYAAGGTDEAEKP